MMLMTMMVMVMMIVMVMINIISIIVMYLPLTNLCSPFNIQYTCGTGKASPVQDKVTAVPASARKAARPAHAVGATEKPQSV